MDYFFVASQGFDVLFVLVFEVVLQIGVEDEFLSLDVAGVDDEYVLIGFWGDGVVVLEYIVFFVLLEESCPYKLFDLVDGVHLELSDLVDFELEGPGGSVATFEFDHTG